MVAKMKWLVFFPTSSPQILLKKSTIFIWVNCVFNPMILCSDVFSSLRTYPHKKKILLDLMFFV